MQAVKYWYNKLMGYMMVNVLTDDEEFSALKQVRHGIVIVDMPSY